MDVTRKRSKLGVSRSGRSGLAVCVLQSVVAPEWNDVRTGILNIYQKGLHLSHSIMNGKVHTAEELPVPPDLLNPFVHRLELSTTYDKIKVSTIIQSSVKILIH